MPMTCSAAACQHRSQRGLLYWIAAQITRHVSAHAAKKKLSERAMLVICVQQQQAGAAEGGRPRFEQPRAAAWLGLRAVLDLLRPAPMAAVLRDFPGLFAAAVKCLASGDPQSSWAALACLHRFWEVLGGEVGRRMCFLVVFWEPCVL